MVAIGERVLYSVAARALRGRTHRRGGYTLRTMHAIGFDDAPFAREHRGDVPIVGAIFADQHLHGIVTGRVRRDGANAAAVMARIIRSSRFTSSLRIILLQGIAVAGFNVVDVFRLHRDTGLPVLVVARRPPNFDAIRDALLHRIPGGARKWRIVEHLGPMEKVGAVWIQRVGLDLRRATQILDRFTIDSNIPEPLRVAHIMAGAMERGESRGRV